MTPGSPAISIRIYRSFQAPPAIMPAMRARAASLLQALKDYGAREIFGIPGDFVLPFYKVIEESKILPHVTLSHEIWG
jgi:Thiamine pyrophosphate enzyme, N-terminal TPP binding domain